MSPFTVVVGVLLFAGVACQLVCALGVLVMRGPLDKLHYAAAGTTVGAFLVGGAIAARETLHVHGAVEVSSVMPMRAPLSCSMGCLEYRKMLPALLAQARQNPDTG